MRGALTLLACAVLGSCSSTTMAEPRILVSPYMAVYQLRGKTAMQSQPVANGPLQNNDSHTLRTFGLDHHKEDIGVRADIGDGFAGLRIDFYQLDMNTSQHGILDADWGRLLENDIARMSARMDELRIGYLEPVFATQTEWREQPLDIKFAAGGIFTHRSLTLRGRTEDGMRSQNAQLQGDNLYPAVRARVTWRELTFDADYAISPEIALGGDFDHRLQDLELRLSYSIPMRDVTVFAGYRYSELPADGDANGFAYDADLVLDGFQLGLQVSF